MATISGRYDVIVVGAGVGGVAAALGAARAGAHVLLAERMKEVGGTGVHSPVGILCGYRAKPSMTPVNLGVLREFHPWAFTDEALAHNWAPAYDEKELGENYRRLLASEPGITVVAATTVAAAEVEVTEQAGRMLLPQAPQPLRYVRALTLEGRMRGRIEAAAFVDSTADGNLSALCGAEFQLGRPADGALQPSTLTFKMVDIDFAAIDPAAPFERVETRAQLKKVWGALEPLYQELKRSGNTSNPRENVLCFQYPDGRALLFNQTRVLGVDPTRSESVAAARAEGEKQIREFVECISRHPAFRNARIESISPLLGVREGRRVLGDYVLTQEDCLGQARFDDMIAACAYEIDIHNPDGGGTVILPIPGSGYYHVPRRSILARGFGNLLLGSRCISGTHEAHSSYRVMAPLAAIGQAAGVNAALAALPCLDARAVSAARVRWELHRQGAFVEGELEAPHRDDESG